MKNFKPASVLTLSACLATFATVAVAPAQSKHHVRLDQRAAQADIKRLQKDRRRALKYQNWGKVAQDDRLIAADKLWILKDKHKLHN